MYKYLPANKIYQLTLMKFLIEIVFFLVYLNGILALRKTKKDSYLIEDIGKYMVVTEFPDEILNDEDDDLDDEDDEE